jgi:hypothetical protein
MVAKYPVASDDQEGIVDAVNYLLSGPAGLGQNFDGYSAYVPAYLRPSNRQPWSLPILVGTPPTTPQPLNPSIYLELAISNIVLIGPSPQTFFTVTFATPQATAPFQFGDRLDLTGVVDTGSGTPFDDTGYTVFSCTATDVVLGYYTNGAWNAYNYNTYVSGGTVGRDYLDGTPLDTDCNARISVQGGTDQVFINAQINLSWEYVCNTNSNYDLKVSIVRLRGFPSDTPGSTEYLFADTVTVSEKIITFSATAGSGTATNETIFTSVLDGPNLDFGYYWYILNIEFGVTGSFPSYDVEIGRVTTGLRSLTAQAVKE